MKKNGDENTVRQELRLACALELGLNFDEMLETDDLTNVVAHIEQLDALQIRKAALIVDFLIENQLDDAAIDNLNVCLLQIKFVTMKLNGTLDWTMLQQIRQIAKQIPIEKIPKSLKEKLKMIHN